MTTVTMVLSSMATRTSDRLRERKDNWRPVEEPSKAAAKPVRISHTSQTAARDRHAEDRRKPSGVVTAKREGDAAASDTCDATPEEVPRTKQRQLSEPDDARRKQIDALADAERRAASLLSELNTTKALLKIRTEELRAAEVFLTKADAISGEDVRRMVEALNAEIFQSAAHIADTCRNRSATFYPMVGTRAQTIRASAAASVGERLVQELWDAQGCVESILIQVAVQACMARYAARIVGMWVPGVDGDQGLLVRMHQEMTRGGW